MKNKLLWIVNGLLLIACVYLFFALFEPYKEEVDAGWSDTAIRNPYLAAHRYLERQGVPAHTLDTLSSETSLDGIDTLFIEDSRAVLSPQQSSRLMEWVRAGGFLIVAAHFSSDDDSDPLLAMLDVSVERSECDCKTSDETDSDESTSDEAPSEEIAVEPAPEESEPEEANREVDRESTGREIERPISDWLRRLHEDPQPEDEEQQKVEEQDYQERIDPDRLTYMEFYGTEETLRAYFSPYWSLTHPYLLTEDGEDYTGLKPMYWSGSSWGTHLMQFEMGEGMLTIVSDPTIWHSDEIDLFDHAYLLTILTKHSRSMYFLSVNRMPSIFSLAWTHAKEIIIAFGCWLMLWLLYRGRRFLPPTTLSVTVRRSVLEHINAVAHFLWRRHATDKLLKSLRQEIHHRAILTLADYAAGEPAQRVRALSKHSGVAEQAVFTALSADNIRQQEQFTEAVQSLQKIRSTL